MREMSWTDNPIKQARFFYHNEDEYTYNFEDFLQLNPVKEKVVVEEILLLLQIVPWKCRAKSAVYKGHLGLDIRNGVGMS